jgi:hypothetical protein
VRFRFMYSPEYLKLGVTILLREGRTKILGTITRLVPDRDLTEAELKENELEAKGKKEGGGRRRDKKKYRELMKENKEPEEERKEVEKEKVVDKVVEEEKKIPQTEK